MAEHELPNGMVDKIRKLLALSTSPNENEAAAAAAMASRLLAEHNLTMAQVNKTAETRVEESTPSGKNKEKWVTSIWGGVARLNFCKYYIDKTNLRAPITHVVIGTQANVTSTQIMADYLVDTVQRLALEADISGLQRNAFKLGAAHRLWARLDELKKQRAAGEKPVGDGSNLPALADLYKVHETDNEDFFKSLHSFKLGRGQGATTKNRGAYYQGSRAADGISLNSQVGGKGAGLLK